MTTDQVLIGMTVLFGLYMAWNIGANDVANAMGTSVGSGALTLRRAVVLAAIFEFAGAYIVGANVSETVRKKIFDPMKIEQQELAPITAETDVKRLDALANSGSAEGDRIKAARLRAARILACGMIAALLAAGTWLMTASYFHWPVSTTHSIVGAVVGFGCVALGWSEVAWDKVALITSGWIVSPLLSGAVAYLLFNFVLRNVFYKNNPVAAAKQMTPYMVFMVLVVLIGVTVFKGLKPLWGKYDIDPLATQSLLATAAASALVGLIGAMVAKRLVAGIRTDHPDENNQRISPYVANALHKATVQLRRVRDAGDTPVRDEAVQLLKEIERLHDTSREQVTLGSDSEELRNVERIFVYLQILSACFVAFSHGSNDVANAIGPLAAAFDAIDKGQILVKAPVPAWALALGGVGIVAGLAMWGWRVIETVGRRITELTPSRGFCAEFAAAITILLASTLPIGLPVSTTHTLVGAVLGVGLARGIGGLNLTTMRDVVAGWIITIPAGAGLAVVFYYLLKSFVLG